MAKRSSDTAVGLVRSLSLTHAVLYGLGVTIGAGIYVLIGVAAGRSGMHAPLAFLISAVALAPVAAVFAELGTRMPVSASEAAYVEAAFATPPFTIAVGLLVIGTAIVSAATISAGSASYIGAMVDLPSQAIIAAVVVIMGLVASMATRKAVAVAGAMTVIEVGGLALIIAAGSANGGEIVSRLPELMPAAQDSAAWSSLAGSSLVAVFAFIGFEHLVNVAEEIEAPSRNLPRALFLTLAITAALYALVAWIAVIAVAPAELAASPAPLALVFGRLTGMGAAAMGGIAIVATLNGVVVHMIMISRVIYGLSRQNNLPAVFSRVDPVTRTPLIATAFAVGAILVLALLVPLAGLADIASRGTLMIFAIVSVALIAIKRKKGPAAEGTFVCPAWVAASALFSSVLLLAAELV